MILYLVPIHDEAIEIRKQAVDTMNQDEGAFMLSQSKHVKGKNEISYLMSVKNKTRITKKKTKCAYLN